MEVWEEFKKELVYRKYSASTVKTYCDALIIVLSRIGERPTIPQIKEYLSEIQSVSTHKHHLATIRNYFAFVLKKKLKLSDIPYPRGEHKIPEVLSVEEIRAIFSQIKNFKHRAIFALLYGCGLRIGEVLSLKIKDIDPSRMVINIRHGKGNKDRQVMMDQKLLRLLRNYVSSHKPKEYMFNGLYGGQYTEASINAMLKIFAKKGGVKKSVHAHLLRHSFATHLLECGTEMVVIQKLMGHSHIKTTQIYAQVSSKMISSVKPPISVLL